MLIYEVLQVPYHYVILRLFFKMQMQLIIMTVQTQYWHHSEENHGWLCLLYTQKLIEHTDCPLMTSPQL